MKMILNQTQWDRFKEAFKMTDEQIEKQYGLDKPTSPAFISPKDFKAMGGRIRRRRKYASYQNHLNRKGK